MKRNVSLIMLIAVMLLAAAVSASAYTPRPGVLSPDEVDFGGKTVTIQIRDVDWVIHNGGKPLDERIAEAEELFNVKIETATFGWFDALMARIMSGDSTYDIFRFNHRSGYFPLVSAGMLYPVGQILPEEYYESLPQADQYAIEKLAYEGEYYGFGVMHGLFNATMSIMSYDYDKIEEAGLEDPYQLWKEGRWDYKTFEEYCVALTQDTDGDGVIDQWGYVDVANAVGAIRFLPCFNGVEFAQQDENGKWVFALNRNELINGLNLVHRWRNELGILGGTAVFHGSHLAGLRHRIAAGDIEFGMVPHPIGPDMDRHYYPAFDFSSNFLPINAEYPEGLIALADFLFREEDTEEYLDFYINNYMVSREHMEVYMAGVEGWAGEGDAFQNTELWDLLGGPIGEVVRGEKGAAAAIDEVAPQAQSFLDDLFGQ
ncbi:MAG: hypothetical protein ACE3NC_06625 [Candidatus Wallacebacter cryptica]|jgi:ABC-type glycerol-3-phosphate transport system substrate-binding protein